MAIVNSLFQDVVAAGSAWHAASRPRTAPPLAQGSSSPGPVPCATGEVAEWLKAAVLKTAGRKPRGFESHPLRQPGPCAGRADRPPAVDPAPAVPVPRHGVSGITSDEPA